MIEDQLPMLKKYSMIKYANKVKSSKVFRDGIDTVQEAKEWVRALSQAIQGSYIGF